MISLRVWILITITFTSAQVRGECEIIYNDGTVEGFQLGDSCYYGLESQRGFSWNDASQQCDSIGGELAEIKDKETLDAVKAYISSLPTWTRNYKQFWLGQTFNYATRRVQFKDGSSKSQGQLSDMWYAGQPSCSTKKVTLNVMAVFRSQEYLQRRQYNQRFQGLWTTSASLRRNALCVIVS